ncbi:tudor domain-containing 6 [Centroberyx gerrardi]
MQSNGHLSLRYPSVTHNVLHEHLFPIESAVNVKISCIESLEKFWCQTADNSDSLRLLMQDMQNHYASSHCQSLVESICVARHPDNGMWYRARIIADHHSPVVDVRFVDYGETRKVPMQDLRPIEPGFLQLNAQAFQCCLFSLKHPTNPAAATWSSAALAEFQKFVGSVASSNSGLKCIIKAVMPDSQGLSLHVVDVETPFESACTMLAQKWTQGEAHMQVPPLVTSDAYNYSTHNTEVGGKEKVWITYSESVNHFYCQLDRNSHLFDKVMENVKQLMRQPQCTDPPLGLNSVCFAKYTDNQWYRGQIIAMSPNLQVHFVDYGDTLAVNKSDICPCPVEASTARSVPVQAVPLGLFNVPADVPQEVNKWFADLAFGHYFTISVVAKDAKEKLIVELCDGSLNVNVKVREMIANVQQRKETGLVQLTDQQLSESSKQTFSVPREECQTQEHMNMSPLRKMTEQNKVHSSNGMCVGAEQEMTLQSMLHVSVPEGELGKTLDERKKTSSSSNVTQLNCPEGSVNICSYKKPNIFQNKTEEVYASCIVGPHYFWCQPANTEDLNKVSRLAQKVGQSEQRTMFPETLDPGSPCLALFASDKQWYRAQVIRKTGNTLFVLFIDYGNESEVDIKDVTSLPPSLFEIAPQAFLCSLNGFDESKGAWDDSAFDDFYNLLVDKPLNVTVFDMEDHLEIAVPQYTVKIEYGNMVVNKVMEKYWKGFAKENPVAESPESETSKGGQTESTVPQVNCSEGNMNICSYKKPNISQNKTEEVYASCIVGPHYFWCQPANTEDLNKVSRLTQEVGQSEQHTMFPETLGPGSPCLALFASDKQWYRAQVIRKTGNSLFVLFIDYGNESDVDIKDVRSLPPSLFETAPQAFLCSLDGFDDSKGTWDDRALDDFYNLLVDKPLNMTMFNMEDHLEIAVPQYKVKIECGNMVVNKVMEKYWKGFATESAMAESCQSETLNGGQTESNMTQLNCPQGNMNICSYKKPNISQNKTEEVYASCIVGPHYFWCQPANMEDLNEVSRLAQELGQSEQRTMFPETLGPGSPCLALFASDKQWYRAQVIRKTGNSLFVLFIDYGNESDVDIKDVRSLPPSLFETAPQAFLCSLDGFDDSKGTWDDRALDDFYNLLVDIPLNMTMFNMEDHLEIAVPQYKVKIEYGNMVVNKVMEKYWKGFATENAMAESPQSG